MGKLDILEKEYMSDPGRFADAFNHFLYKGRDVIRAENLTELDSTEIALMAVNDSEEAVQKFRDVLKQCVFMEDDRAVYLLLGIEAQSEIHYAMPVRNMLYDALNYGKQVRELARQNRTAKKGMGRGEFLTGLLKTDKLKPVVTLVIFFGVGTWDGPRCLKDMFPDVGEEVLQYVSDYKVNLLIPSEIRDFQRFSSDLGKVLHYIALSESNEGMDEIRRDPSFTRVENESVRLINAITKSKIKINQKGKVTNVCKAWTEYGENARKEGRKEGREQGRIEIIAQMYDAGKIALQEACGYLNCTEEDFLAKIYKNCY